jgi:hypothetical protein
LSPGPGEYDSTTKYSSKYQRFPTFKMGTKTNKTCLLDGEDPLKPGPGTYKSIGMDKDGKYTISKFMNSKCPTFGVRVYDAKLKRLSNYNLTIHN